ncbi:MAG TPA: beta-ketoacyl synthase N-terminal-like domain-containing protein, partial [Vicinamibacterales bacterium]
MPGKVVFAFPGQGSFAPDLLRRMYDTRAGLRPLFYAVDQASGDILGEPFLPMVLGDPARPTGSRDLDQLGIYLANYATAQLWIERGLTPDALLGHSFGELAAFATAGIFSFEDGARMVCQRVLSLREGAVPGKMVAVSAAAERVQAMLDQFAANSVISVVNHPEQTVVSGPEPELAELRERFAKEAVSVTQLQSNYPFHSPLLAGASRAFRIALRGHRFANPQYPVMVGTDLAWVGSETDVTDAMARQLVTPLNFVALVGRYTTDGYSRFVECGGGTIVTKVIAKVLKSSPHQAWATFPVASDINDRLAAIEREMASAPAAPVAAIPTSPPAPPVRVASVAPVAPVAPAAPVAPDAPAPTEPIAIIGMGCVLPGGADSPEQYWRNITTGVSGIVDLADSVPHARHDFVGGDAAKIVSDKTYTLLNGSVVKVRYDAALLAGRYSEEEFSFLTKGQQMLAIAIAQADRGLKRSPQARVQCILGSTADGVAELDEAHFAASVREVLKRSDVPAPAAEAFGRQLNGGLPGWQRHPDEFRPYDLYAAVSQKSAGIPREQTYLVDSACSSSLYSLALGARALRNGEADVVYAGGVFAPGPANNNLFAQFRGLTPNASRPFDAKADGVVFGDGAGVLVLKRLSDAIDAGDKIAGVIRSEGFSSDGKSPSINVPQAEGQAAAVQVAYTRAALDTRSVQYVEAHATATPVGDAVEFKALKRAFPDKADRLLGSVKALIGHTGWTSGVASVIKICKALEHRTIPRQFAYTSPNPQIDLADTGFAINVADAPWLENQGGEPRRAAINSFGFGGTNAHFVVEEFKPDYHTRVAASFRGRSAASPEVVIVGAEGLFPESGSAFDRKSLRMPKKRMVLPDVAEHMDATQYLATMAAELIAETLPADVLKNDAMRIGVALGVESKTERGVRANERVFLDRLERVVNGAAASSDVLGRIRHQILSKVIPSGPYTLPGLMPNVAASRITHTFDWHGPNIVVDRGASSLAEALQVGLKFVRAGDCELVLAGGVHAWVGHNNEDQEGVALAAISTADTAAKYNLPILARVQFGAPSAQAVAVPLDVPGRTRAATGARELVQAVRDVRQRAAEVVLRANGNVVMTLVPADRPRVA